MKRQEGKDGKEARETTTTGTNPVEGETLLRRPKVNKAIEISDASRVSLQPCPACLLVRWRRKGGKGKEK